LGGNAQNVRTYDLPGNGPHLIEYLNNKKPNVETLGIILDKYYGLKQGYSYRLVNQLIDQNNVTHSRYQFYFNELMVVGSQLIVHHKGGKINAINGRFYKVSASSIGINKEQALDIVLDSVRAKKYMWELPEEELELKKIDKDPKASYFPKASMVYVPAGFNFNKPFRLAYEFKVYAQEPLSYKSYYVDIQKGQIIATQSLLMHGHDTGSAKTAYSGTKTIFTDSFGIANYRLRDSLRDVRTYDMNTGTNYAKAVDFTDTDNDWDNVNPQKDEVATDAHWGAEMTYDYFLKVHNRNSYDNNGARILSYVHYRSNYDNAFWDGRRMTYGDGNKFKPLTALDVCGHEIAHAVTTNTAGLIYRYESGALNESFSDIFGNTVEAWARPNSWSWKIGEDISKNGSGLRNMENPNLKNHPKFYKGVRWYYGSGDNGGVHLNSGVQNYWYYLLVEGDTGTNEKNQSYKIQKLGFNKAAKIAYRNLSVYLTPSSNYAEARIYAIRSASDLYGPCSPEVVNTTNAWFVCGVGARYDSSYVKANFIADTIVCSTNDVVNFSNLSTNYKYAEWTFGDGDTSSMAHPKHSYDQYDVYDIKLKVQSCFDNKWDSLTKKQYVKVDSSLDICNAIFMPTQGTDSISYCDGYIYDEGGLNDYNQNKVTYLKITSPGADSISIQFEELDYERNYDTLTLYDGAPLPGNEIGKYYSSVIPNGGQPIIVHNNYISLRQWSDPYVVGKGFKAKFLAFKKPLMVEANRDTLLCVGDSLNLFATGSGGFADDYTYTWNKDTNTNSYWVYPDKDSLYSVHLYDGCTKELVHDTVHVFLRDSLSLKLPKDTTVCFNESIDIIPQGLGGDSTYTYLWLEDGTKGPFKNILAAKDSIFTVVLTDECSNPSDTGTFKLSVRDPLSVKIGASDTILCYNQEVVLKALYSGGDSLNRNVEWAYDKSNLDSIRFTPSTSGWYHVKLEDGCSPVSRDSIYIEILKPLELTKTADTTICYGSDVLLNLSLTGGKVYNYVYNWGHKALDTSSVLENLTSNRVFYFTASDACSPTLSDSIVVSVMSPLKLNDVRDSLICFGQSVNLNLNASGGISSNYKYEWNHGLGSGRSKVVSPKSDQTYEVVLSDGCSSPSDSISFVIQVRDKLDIGHQLNKARVCLGDSVSLSFNPKGGINPYELFLDGELIGSQTRFLKPNLAKTSYQLELKDGCSLSDTVHLNFLVDDLPDFTINVSKDSLCLGDSVILNHNFGSIATYNWLLNGLNISAGSSINWSPSSIGSFDFSLQITDQNGCSNLNSNKQEVTVVNVPLASFGYNPMELNIENALVTTMNYSKDAESYLWDFGDNLGYSNEMNPIYTYTDTGMFAIRLVAVNSLGCSDDTTISIRVKPVYKLFLPNAFTPNNDGLNDLFQIKGTGFDEAQLFIFNKWGEKVYEQKGTNLAWDGTYKNKAALEGSYLYIIELVDVEGERHFIKSTISILR
jgi:gliding motility-associated-like protein